MAQGKRLAAATATPEESYPERPEPADTQVSPLVPPPVDLGVSGTPNWFGDLYTEQNPELYHQAGFGQAGSRTWGTWEEMLRTDPDVSSSLEFLLGQVRDARVDIATSEEHPDQTLAKAQADFVRHVLTEQCEPGLSEVLRQQCMALVFGFAMHEIIPGLVRHPALPGGLGWGLKKLAERLPVSVHPNGWLEDDGELRGIKQQGVKDGRWIEAILPSDKVLLTTWNRDGNNYAGRSAYRSVRYLVKVRAHMLRIAGIGFTREGLGIPVATSTDLKAKLTPKQRRSLFKLLANLVYHENAAVVMPAGWNLDWVYSKGADKGGVIDAWAKLGEVILRQLAAQQMTLGVNGTGSRSVGEVHDVNADAFVQGVLATLETVWNGIGQRPYTGIVRKLVRWNWGEQPTYPKLTLKPKKAKLKPAERATAAKTAKEAGLLTVTADDENTMRDDLGFAPIDEAVRSAELEKTRQAELEKAAAAPPPGFPPTQREGDFPPKPPARAKASATFVPSRPLRAAEKVLDLQGMLDFLDRSRTRFEEEIRPIVGAMLIKAAPALTQAMADGDPSDVHLVPLDEEKLRAEVTAFLARVRETGRTQVATELAKHKGEKVAEDRREPNEPPKLQAAAEDDSVVENITRALIRRITTRLRAELETEAIDALRTGEDAEDVVAGVLARQLDTGAFRSDAGSVLTKVWNVGRAEAADMLGADRAEYSAILDGRQCIPCDRMDGRQFDIGSPDYEAALPPNRDCDGGANCRCMMAYLPGSREEG